MGASSISPFDDDDGADFAAEILVAEDWKILADAIYAVPLEDGVYVESGTSTRALIAAELMAASLARESGDVPDELQAWVEQQLEVDFNLLHRARLAIQRILRDSELRELWSESDAFADWKGRTKQLLKNLE